MFSHQIVTIAWTTENRILCLDNIGEGLGNSHQNSSIFLDCLRYMWPRLVMLKNIASSVCIDWWLAVIYTVNILVFFKKLTLTRSLYISHIANLTFFHLFLILNLRILVGHTEKEFFFLPAFFYAIHFSPPGAIRFINELLMKRHRREEWHDLGDFCWTIHGASILYSQQIQFSGYDRERRHENHSRNVRVISNFHIYLKAC